MSKMTLISKRCKCDSTAPLRAILVKYMEKKKKKKKKKRKEKKERWA